MRLSLGKLKMKRFEPGQVFFWTQNVFLVKRDHGESLSQRLKCRDALETIREY